MASLMATTPDTGDDNDHDDHVDDGEHDYDDRINTDDDNDNSLDEPFMSRCDTGWHHPGRK